MRKVLLIALLILTTGIFCYQTVDNLQAAPITVASSSDKPVTRSESQVRSAARNKVAPKYPVKAMQDNSEGDVYVDIIIDEEGKVISAKATEGPEIFRNVSEEASLQWTFEPFKVDNKPVQVKSTLSYRFQLRNNNNVVP